MKDLNFFYKLFNIKSTIISVIVSMIVMPLIAHAHGYATNPTARQLFCNKDGGHWGAADGSSIPNKACKEAFLKSGTFPFVQINEYSALTEDYNNIEAVKKSVPNGHLCSANDPKKSGMDIVSPDWQKTTVTSGQIVHFKFLATAAHNPSFWEIYLTKSGFDPKKSTLRWEDLEIIAKQGDIKTVNGYYEFDITIPKGRSGDAILYTRWQRVDPAGEGFYNCSDITIK